MAAALARGRNVRAGLWLAAAICLKVIPAFLVLYPLWRRNLRCLGGCVLGLALGLGVVPAAVFGTGRAVAYYREWARVLVLPALSLSDDRSRADELLDMTATHNQSFMALFHNTLYPDPDRRPAAASPVVWCAHWLVGGCLTLVALVAAGCHRREPAVEVIFLGALIITMLALSPAGHPHYYALLVLPLMGFTALALQDGGRDRSTLALGLLLGINFVASGLPLLPGGKGLHDRCTALLAALVIWTASVAFLWRAGREAQVSRQGVPAAPLRPAA
jgi:hypothetical protein